MLISEIGTLILPILSLELPVVINVLKSQPKSWVKNCKQASTCSLGDLFTTKLRNFSKLGMLFQAMVIFLPISIFSKFCLKGERSIALQYFVFLQKDLATFTTNEGWSFLISGIWWTIRSSKHLRHPKRREKRRKRLPQDS